MKISAKKIATKEPERRSAPRRPSTPRLSRLDTLAQRIEPKAKWGDLSLPTKQVALLRRIAEQGQPLSNADQGRGTASKAGRGIGVVFSGGGGAGKFMAAEVLAGDLGLALYRIDLSAVVSKYIGETEKNLARVFAVAEKIDAVLLFDEADALFGKRSEVKDSHDRYANIEVNYLLQRIEAYNGLVILATNMKSDIDAAFLRRLRFIIEFPMPTAEDRRSVWQKVPKGSLDTVMPPPARRPRASTPPA